MSLQAYKTAATRAETPREMEYRLFGQVTRALMHAATVTVLDDGTVEDEFLARLQRQLERHLRDRLLTASRRL